MELQALTVTSTPGPHAGGRLEESPVPLRSQRPNYDRTKLSQGGVSVPLFPAHCRVPPLTLLSSSRTLPALPA
eukprot:scaffold15257_cov101-Isochrysis_galbana.AAC.1